MNQWLDSLSEDWVSQPRSQHSSPLVLASPTTDIQGSLSRIPRPKSRVPSDLPARKGQEAKGLASKGSIGRQGDVLKVRTQSELNTSHSRTQKNPTKPKVSRSSSNSSQIKKDSPAFSPQPLDGTVQQKASPAKTHKGEATPEWKQRLINAGAGKADLFSPKAAGLEGVFKPPTVSKRSPPKAAAKRRTAQDENRPPIPRDRQENAPSRQKANSKLHSRDSSHMELATVDHEQSFLNPGIESKNKFISDGPSIGGSEQSRSDSFSPVYISKHDTTDGRVDYAAIDKSMKQLQSNMDQLRIQQKSQHNSRSSSRSRRRSNASSSEGSVLHKSASQNTSQSLPDDLSVGTDLFAANCAFVSVKRGGYSDEGSFRRRPLSPSSSMKGLDGPSIQNEKSSLPRPAGRTPDESPAREESKSPKTPGQQPGQVQSSPERPRSSGSPLKLFDKYDTFTNDRLVRRMSKFEEALVKHDEETSQLEEELRSFTPSPVHKSPLFRQDPMLAGKSRDPSRVSSFGDGQLDDYAFPHPNDREPVLPQLLRKANDRIDNQVPNGRSSSKGKSQQSRYSHHSLDKGLSDRHNQKNSAEYDMPAANPWTDEPNDSENSLSEVHHTIHGKRLPRSPVKNPAAKRRRTIRSSEERRRAESVATRAEAIQQETLSKSLLGRKRKDALYENDQQAADPRILALREIRRPRNPTPNHASSSARASSENSQVPGDTTGEDSPTGQVRLDPPTQIVAGALATIALNTAQDITQGSRKTSVTTADFFSEAQQIMRLIRAEKRPHSSHATAETPQVEHQIPNEESFFAESTKEQFSRPPSREGRNPRELMLPIQTDARIVSRLRKYEDKDDLGLALSSSLKSLKMSRSRISSDTSIVHRTEGPNENGHESHPLNIRILEGAPKFELGPSQSSHKEGSYGNKSQPDSQRSDQSAKRSIGTGSSSSSGNKLVIAPETVAHLLSNQMAGMVFDRERQLWIKRKGSVNTKATDSDELSSESSEEDLFGDIPDLSVDEMDELQRVKDAASTGNTLGSGTSNVQRQDHVKTKMALPALHDNQTFDERPRTAEGKLVAPIEDSSAPSKYSHFASSGPAPSTRATSWGEEHWSHKPQSLQGPALPAVDENIGQDSSEEVEHEISILEGRATKPSNRAGDKRRQARVVTVAFSSPLVDQMQSPDLGESWDNQNQGSYHETPSRLSHWEAPSSRRKPSTYSKKPILRSSSRRMSMGEHSYIARPMSRLDEHEEMSLVQFPVKGNRPLDVAISTPHPTSKCLIAQSNLAQSSGAGFQLSPLADFTVHQIDRVVDGELGTMTKRTHTHSLAEANGRLSLTAQDLVKHLTDLEPYEPYWEYIRSVDLRGRGLTTLHMLNEFCSQAEEIDVSDNKIGDLNGIPSSVRLLNIRGNQLSDLSAWHYLKHLQYLDISGNGLTSLRGLQGLAHLRALKADNNAIESLEGLEDLDGLLSLRMRSNRLRNVDLEVFNLRRLTELDLRGNGILEVRGIHCTPGLRNLCLSDNCLETFSPEFRSPCLETLDLAGNSLTTVKVRHMLALAELILDDNKISDTGRLEELTSLRVISLREQRSTVPLQYQTCHEIHHLNLSGNALSEFSPTTPFLNLQTIELASTGLQALPPDFGIKCPNLRIVNLNYNALRDLRPLLNIVKLQRLHLAGNRISRLRRTVSVLERLPSVVELDLRNNPLTVGFYTPPEPKPPVEEKRIVVQNRHQKMTMGEENEGGMKYILSPLDVEADTTSRDRLDEDTKLRRRVYEMLTVVACKRLQRLDGLEVDRRVVGSRDGVWERLRELGVLRSKTQASEYVRRED